MKRPHVHVFEAELYLGVQISTRGTFLPYIGPTWGLPTFCIWTVCTGRFPAYPAKIRSFPPNVFRQSHKAY